MNSLNAYWHAKASCQYWDSVISDRHLMSNKDFLKCMIAARKASRILITEIEKAYKQAGIDIEQIGEENEVIFQAMEIMQELTDSLQIKPILKVKM
jgi:hypothetical protein